MPRDSSKSKTKSRASKCTEDDDDYKMPLLSINASQLSFLHLAGPYYQQALNQDEGEEFIDLFFEKVYHPLYPVPHHEFFCMEAAEHGKGILKKVSDISSLLSSQR